MSAGGEEETDDDWEMITLDDGNIFDGKEMVTAFDRIRGESPPA
jgi:hypothetical protein